MNGELPSASSQKAASHEELGKVILLNCLGNSYAEEARH